VSGSLAPGGIQKGAGQGRVIPVSLSPSPPSAHLLRACVLPARSQHRAESHHPCHIWDDVRSASAAADLPVLRPGRARLIGPDAPRLLSSARDVSSVRVHGRWTQDERGGNAVGDTGAGPGRGLGHVK
jgi:hypothetical protein